MAKERVYQWYVEPLDAHTNATVSGMLSAGDACQGIKCYDGTRRDLWCCDHQAIAKLRRSRQDLSLKFKIYIKEGGGQIRPWQFES
jgi:hypothetical protein